MARHAPLLLCGITIALCLLLHSSAAAAERTPFLFKALSDADPTAGAAAAKLASYNGEVVTARVCSTTMKNCALMGMFQRNSFPPAISME